VKWMVKLSSSFIASVYITCSMVFYYLFLSIIFLPQHILCKLVNKKSWLTQLNKNYEDWVNSKYEYGEVVNR